MKIEENILLSNYSNYKIGGPARFFCVAHSESDIGEALDVAAKNKLPFFVLGGGTNLLIDDGGFPGVVIKPELTALDVRGDTLYAEAGVEMSRLLEKSVEAGFGGLEWAGGLPGTVGGAVRGNAGCFGGEMKDVVLTVTSFDVAKRELSNRANPQCEFDYRSSIFKTKPGQEIILSVIFDMKKGNPAEIRRAIEEKVDYRKERHPLEYPNIGSIFKNIPLDSISTSERARFKDVVKTDPFPVVPAAYLISEAGLKGESRGGAQVSPKHPNFIVNIKKATSADVFKLIALVKAGVKKKFGIQLEEEVQALPDR